MLATHRHESILGGSRVERMLSSTAEKGQKMQRVERCLLRSLLIGVLLGQAIADRHTDKRIL